MFLNWAFLGGTALHFLFNIPRYSEDLDFTLIQPELGCEFEKVLRKIKTLFELEKYDIQIKVSPDKTVMSSFLNFPGILYEMGISPHENEVLSIKLEIDTRPQEMVNIAHYDKASLLAGKLHAILSRPYTKGCDKYDLIWYLSDDGWLSPNFSFLNSALEQTNWGGDAVNRYNLKDILYHRMSGLQWNKVQDDLMPFIERQQDLSLVTRENCLGLIAGKKL